ncbi:hypothetical protein HMPREF2760_12320 [Corynebacterium sp. HMSC065D07]|uniref:HAD family hydrolase n=1 Tax=Corynebacterium sp. HMSC065D07 TaxID=1739264 RepID=UPI0008A15F0A|nr:HAD family hydrolase [Corynebacterium sp. HMSC065D07]OFL59800.1 hypothetical protein HMPREF2760_12320 [Corynebacterium sp. HMSC065D07]
MSKDISPPVLLFDFDGTVSLGHGPVLAYARHIGEATGNHSIPHTAEHMLSTNDASLVHYRDGYDLVRSLATDCDAPEDSCQQAYMASRLNLADTGITAPEGLAEFLGSYPGRVVLATNSPETGLAEALKVLGLSNSFDAIYTRVGKPDGLTRILESDFPDSPIIAFGDIWDFDLAPVAARGGHTVLLETPFATPADANPTWRAQRVTDIFSELSSAF